jgi:hypothetical protein
MHTDQTLKILDTATVEIGEELRKFNGKTCPAFDTKELKREADARTRRLLKKARRSSRTAPGSAGSAQNTRLSKQFSLQTYKLHSLGDYAATIRMFGTTDSYSTERVSNFQIMNHFPAHIFSMAERA